jgi:colicin import membrane protein
MSAAALGRDPFMPRPPPGRGPALGLALLAHVLLIAALAFGVHWRNSEPTTVAAELWSAMPQAAAPRAVEPEPAPTPRPTEVKRPEPRVNAPEPVAPPKPSAQSQPALPDPNIAIEQARRDETKRLQAEQDQQRKTKLAKAEREKAERVQDEREKAERERADRQKADQEKAERERAELEKVTRDKLRAKEALAQKKAAADKADAAERVKGEQAAAAQLAATRENNLKRMQGLAGATGGATDTGNAARSSGPSASYAGRIMARIKPNILFSDGVDGNPMATVEVKLAADGTIVGKRLVKSSGVKSWDDAVLRAIERTEVLPRDIDGRVPPPFQIDFRLRD